MGERRLEDLQRFVTDAVRRASPIADDCDCIEPSARGMTPAERLEVYRDQFWLRHWKNLEDDYPTLVWLLGGREAFRELATAYLGACPPCTWDLQRLGADLPAYVASHAPWKDDAILRDAARLDWAFMEAFDAPDAPPFDPGVLAAMPEDAWASARVVLHPSVRLLSLAHGVHALRDAMKRAEAATRPEPEATHVVVWRDGACVQRAERVEPMAFEILAALAGGAPLGESCEAAARAHGRTDDAELGARVGAWFRHWTASGWVSGVAP